MTIEETTGSEVNPLTAESTKKAAVAWVSVADGPATALWCLWVDEALHVVCGPGEQTDPGLSDAATCQVVLRGDHNGRIIGFEASVSRLSPDTPAWENVVPALSGKRLNAPAGDTAARWAAECAVYRLEAAASPNQAGATLPTGSLSEEPRPSPAARPTRKPYKLHRVKKRARRP